MRIACCQLEAKTMETSPSVWAALQKQADIATEDRADLLVFPEITYPAYSLVSRERYFMEDVERSDAVLRRFSDIARRAASWVVAGFVEETDEGLYNSAALFDRTGQLSDVARKQVMWDCDQDWFIPGTGGAVMSTEFGNIGVLICADLRMPEVAATLASRGAGLIVQPTAWVNAGKHKRPMRNVQVEYMVRARALEFGIPIASCSKSGAETPKMGYVGQSMIVDAQGKMLSQAPVSGDATIIADVDLAVGRGVCVSEAQQSELIHLKPANMKKAANDTVTICLQDDASAIGNELRGVNAMVESIPAADLQSFVAARLAAMRGVQVVLTDGPLPDLAILRTRAVENRVFIGAFSADGKRMMIDPNGDVLPPDDARRVSIDLALANDKHFTPRTPIWSQRRTKGYEFALTGAPQASP